MPFVRRIDARKILEILHNLLHPRDALARLAHQGAHIVAQKIQVGFFPCRAHPLPHLDIGDGRLDFFIGSHDTEQILHIFLQRAEVGIHITDRVVDLMRHARSQLAHRGHFF